MTTPIGFEPQGITSIPNGVKPMLFEHRPGRIYQTPFSYYGVNNGDDAYVFNIANAYLINKYGGGIVELAPMVFKASTQAIPTWGANPTSTSTGGNVTVIGDPGNTIWQSTFNGAAWFCHRTAGYAAQFGNPAQPVTGIIRGLTIDGQLNTNPGAIGLDIGDGWNGIEPVAQVGVVNYSRAGQIGVNQINRVGTQFFFEKNVLHYKLSNNATAMVIDNTAGNVSHEYNELHIALFASSNQQGVVIQNGCNVAGCTIYLRGNMAHTSSSTGTPTNNIAALSVIGTGTQLFNCHMFSKIEGNPGDGTGTTYPWQLYSDGQGIIQQCSGHWGGTLNDIQMNGAEFTWSGPLPGCLNGATLRPTGTQGVGGTSTSQPSPPALGTPFINTGPDAIMTVAGGTLTGISIGGVSTGVTSGSFFVRAGGRITLNGSVAPTTFIWAPACNSQG